MDIDEDDNFKGVKERLEISKKNVDKAIQLFEGDKIKDIDTKQLNELQKAAELDELKKKIIDLTIKENYEKEEIEEIEKMAKLFNNKEIFSMLADLFFEWGTDLGNLAKTKQGKQAEDLYLQAFDKFQKAIDIKPDDHLAFYNWGTDLGNLAETKQGKQAEDLYHQAFDKFQKAIDIKPDHHDAFYNWGNSLILLAKTKNGKQAEDLLQQALEKCQKGVEYGGDSYNLSCTYALKKDKKNALKHLNTSLSNNEIDSDRVKKDEDWLLYLEDNDFVQLLEKYRK